MDEVWRNIEGFTEYQVSSNGNIRRTGKDKLMIKTADSDGYNRISLSQNGKQTTLRVARIVARAFPEICGEWFDGCQINHKNEQKKDDRAENLETCTPRYNVLYSVKPMDGRRMQENYPVAQMKNDTLYGTYKSMRFAAEMTGISYPRIRKCVMGDAFEAGGYQWVLLPNHSL